MRSWTVKDVMSDQVVSITRDSPYKEIVEKMAGHGVSALPVVDAANTVVGVVSEADLLHKVEFMGHDQHVQLLERLRRRIARTKASGDLAADVMTAPPVCISADASLSAVARMMADERVKRLPVVDERGRLVGIVSRRDLLSIYLREDAEIGADIKQEVIRRAMWIDPATIDVTVDRGVATISGEVDRRSTAEIAVHLCRSVAGVVDMVDELSYRYDDTADLHRHSFMGATVKETIP
jgi:CBS domain-containing protein